MSDRETCSCGRAEVELGCDLCAYCRRDYEERQAERESSLGGATAPVVEWETT